MKSITELRRTSSHHKGTKTQKTTAVLLFFVSLCLCGECSSAFAATKVFLHDAQAAVQQSPNIVFRLANSTQGSAKVTVVTNSISGAVSGQYWPSATAGHIITKTAGGTKTIWLSAPLASGVTISGTITPNLWGLESNGQCNCGARYEVLRWSVAAGGIVSSLGISTDGGVTEWGTSAAVRTSPTLTPTSTGFSTGDRIALVIYNDDGNGVTEGSGRNWTLDYDAGTGADGDTYLSFTETLSFSADTNNARPIPALSRFDFAVRPAHRPPFDSAQGRRAEPRRKFGEGLLRLPLVFARGPELVEGQVGGMLRGGP